ncbi:hypothetical protein K7472_13760 [Streptomyces sp. PTM05]|uniref:Uncharacterized protein n=1 Tax=Streptantibioticus parmotrematis TaxID=2873249 RepID=A0ABS7QRU9_9ACTN|nr:hypothetical protein [Streptantibioticus parmotrematis]MBY8885913.1 hypothetical protein [Streptantibioticus parmotrematis]
MGGMEGVNAVVAMEDLDTVDVVVGVEDLDATPVRSARPGCAHGADALEQAVND